MRTKRPSSADRHDVQDGGRGPLRTDGKNHDGIPDINPYNTQTVATFDDLTDEQVINLLAQAQKTFESWSQTS
jgi:acyl-CoA reductase-like NAD-dependent aldehyde dehydrogenase